MDFGVIVTYILKWALNKAYDKLDKDADGVVSAEELDSFVDSLLDLIGLEEVEETDVSDSE